MHGKFLPLSVAAILLTGNVGAQTPVAGTTPPPVINSAPAPTPLPPQNQAIPQNQSNQPGQNAVTPTGVTQIVYTPQLPNVTDLTNAANAQGLTVEKMVQTGTQLIAFYRNANGQTSTVAYQTLPPGAGAAAPVVSALPPATVVYAPAPPRVIYYEDPYYYPRVWYPPVSLSFGFGYRGGYHGGGYYGGWRHRH